MAPGDVVLCYCTGTYAGHERSVPGVGIVTAVDWPARRYTYDYVPFKTPVPLAVLRNVFTETDRFKLGNIRWDSFQYFELAEVSLSAVLEVGKMAKATKRG
jgi:hypothetical protein